MICLFRNYSKLTIIKKTYYLLPTILLVFFVQGLFAQSATISGTVTADDGLPLPGASIVIKGTTTGGVSDFDGNFSNGKTTAS